jgi:hypothetical protein
MRTSLDDRFFAGNLGLSVQFRQVFRCTAACLKNLGAGQGQVLPSHSLPDCTSPSQRRRPLKLAFAKDLQVLYSCEQELAANRPEELVLAEQSQSLTVALNHEKSRNVTSFGSFRTVDWADGGGWWSEPSLGSISSAVCVCAMKSGLTSMKHFWPWRALSSAGRFCKGTAVERLGEQTCFLALLASSG